MGTTPQMQPIHNATDSQYQQQQQTQQQQQPIQGERTIIELLLLFMQI
jgi:hypothetical protein